MDYDSLYLLLPKEPKKWLVQDVVIWLQFIGLGQMEDKFVSCSIDGSVLEEITDDDLEEELGVNQKIIKKKLMNWITTGLKEYNTYLCQIKVSTIKKSTSEDFTLQKNLNSSQDKQCQSIINQFDELHHSQNKINNQIENQLILQPLESQQNNFYCIKQTGAKIGRHSSNQILILEENISRFHAEVIYQDSKFYIRDIGSTTGTYIKIQKRMNLFQDMLIELGSNLFQVIQLEQISNGIQFGLLVLEGPNSEEQITFHLDQDKTSVTLGRKTNTDIAFPEDHHLSNLHAKFYLVDKNVIIEDHSSTNGTWLRISPDGQPSSIYPITQNDEITIIRIGTVNQYLCQLDKFSINFNEYNFCTQCLENERDALFLPCKHNSTCFKCSKNLQLCPICKMKISQQIRIYKN
ncbi:unnamed protein product [Paramecium sonneborni]|uniref:Uncharacterized protein n=1 Tax=Paramecium sonneborni TaxID=65129 RepID=A0A8S1P2Z4_9CILI|nr:unnamed protein product [Paramecium sonneborni]